MNNKILKVMVACMVIISMATSVVSAKTLKEIYEGKQPTLHLVKEKKADLVTYTMNRFKDMKTKQWYTESISMLVGLGGVDGYSNGNFGATDNVTVAQFTKLLLSAMGHKEGNATGNEWYKNYVNKAKQLGVIESGDIYNYKAYMKRKDMAKMICKVLNIAPKTGARTVFTDCNGLDTKWMDTAYDQYLIAGVKKGSGWIFNPYGFTTRAQACEMIIRALEYRDNPEKYKEEKSKQFIRDPKTEEIAGFIVPVYDGTNLSAYEGEYLELGKSYPIICFLIDTYGEPEALKKQREDMRQVLLQKYDEKFVNEVMSYINKKRYAEDSLPFKYFYVDDKKIRVGSSSWGGGDCIGVDVYYK